MNTLGKITSGMLLAVMAITGNTTFAASPGELLQQGLYAEEVDGNIDSAIKAYDQVAKDASASSNQVAQALFREGICYVKLKDEASARAVLERLVTDYSSQSEIVGKARAVLHDLTNFDPAAQIAVVIKQARAEAAARNLRQATPATIMLATKAPVIDGNEDESWGSLPKHKLESVLSSFGDGEKASAPTSPDDLSADFRGRWDESNLYLLVNVTDDILRHDTGDWYTSDSVEIYIDADDAKAPQYGQNDYQFCFNWDKTSPTIAETKHNRTNGVEYALVTTDKGYRLKVKFPWQTLGVKPSPGAKIGLDVQVNDSDGGGKRKSKIAWHCKEDNAWNTPQAFGTADLAGLIGWWKFDETTGNTAADSSGCHHTGTLVGNAKWEPGKIGGAIALDGHGSFVRIAGKTAFNMADQTTIACWVNIHSVPVEWMAIITKGDSAWRLSTDQQERRFHMSVNDYNHNDLDAISLNGATEVNADEWHHVASVYDGRVMKLYVDGKLDATKPWTGGMAKNNSDVLIGENVERPNRCFDGLIDDVRIYNYALSESEIKALAAAQ